MDPLTATALFAFPEVTHRVRTNRWERALLAVALTLACFCSGLAPVLQADESGFVLDRQEGYLELWIEAPSGTTDMVPGESRSLRAHVSRRSWEVWTNAETNSSEIRSDQSTPLPDVAVNLWISYGDGGLSVTSGSTDSSGQAETSFTIGSSASGVMASISVDGAYAEASYDVPAPYIFSGPVEEWYYDHSEGTLEASLSTSGSTSEIPPGDSRPLDLSVRYVSWDVYVSNLGGTSVQNQASSPANGAYITWSTEGAGYTSGANWVDASGLATGTVTIGHGGTRAVAVIQYSAGAGTRATSAALDFGAAVTPEESPPPAPEPSPEPNPAPQPEPIPTPEPDPGFTPQPEPSETWTYHHSEDLYRFANLSADANLAQLHSGQQCTITGNLQRDVYDIWISSFGNSDRRYSFSGPASGVNLTVTADSGVSVSDGPIYTGEYGDFAMTFAPGNQGGQLQLNPPGTVVGPPASVSFGVAWSSPIPSDPPPAPEPTPNPDPTPTSEPDPNPPSPPSPEPTPDPASQWSFHRSESYYSISGLSVNGPTYDVPAGAERLISGRVTIYTNSIYRNGNGYEEIREVTESPSGSDALELSIESGDGSIPFANLTADGSGHFQVPFTMGASPSRLRIRLASQGSYQGSTIDFVPPPPPEPTPEVFTLDHKEGSFAVQISPGTTDIREWQQTPIIVQVLETSWEVWVGDQGSTELRNDYQGPAIGVPVQLSLSAGAGNAPNSGDPFYTDPTGAVTVPFSFFQGMVQINASVTYGGASGWGSLSFYVGPANMTTEPPVDPPVTPPIDPPVTPPVDGGVTPPDWTFSTSSSGLEFRRPSSNDPYGVISLEVVWATEETWTRLGEVDRRVYTAPAYGGEYTTQFISGGGTLGITGGADGNPQITYNVTEPATIQITAFFAGQSKTTDFEVRPPAPVGGASGGGSSSSPGTGQAPSTPSTGSPGTGTPAAPGDSGVIIPVVYLTGRTHSTSGGGGGGSAISPDGAPIIDRSFTAEFYRMEELIIGYREDDGTAVYGPHKQTTERSGSESDWPAIRQQMVSEGWNLEPGQPKWTQTVVGYEEGSVEIVETPASAFDFIGTPRGGDPDSETLATLASAAEVASDYTLERRWRHPHRMDEMKFHNNPWYLWDYLAHGDVYRGVWAYAQADWWALYPGASWKEIWFQSTLELPPGHSEQRTFLIKASRRSSIVGNGATIGVGVVTFRLQPGSRLGSIEFNPGTLPAGWVSSNGSALALTPPTEYGKGNAVVLEYLSNPLLVDTNRDGVIVFDGNRDSPEASGKPIDRTSEDKRYRFWINDDQDDKGTTEPTGPEPETYAVVTPDSHDTTIGHPRDLEDFARLWIDLESLRPLLDAPNSVYQIGLKWSNVGPTRPRIRLFAASEPDGGLGYIRDPGKAMAQMSPPFVGALADRNSRTHVEPPVSNGSSADFIFKSSDITGRATLHYIFEGVQEGSGRLDLVILKSDGGQIAATLPGVWLDLKNIKKMYQRANALPRIADFPGPFEIPVGAPIPATYALAADGSLYIPDAKVGWAPGDGTEASGAKTFEPAWDESDEAIVLVHGVGIEVPQYRIWGESAFKRFWWEGYKGRFCSFRWHGEKPLLDASHLGNLAIVFNLPEYRAWTWGGSLRKYINDQVKPAKSKVAIVAHSLGNAVANSAIEQGLSVHSYAMLAGAVSASSFDATAPELIRLRNAEAFRFPIDNIRTTFRGSTVITTYHKVTPPTYVGALSGNVTKLGPKLSSYYNEDDFWLTTGKLPLNGFTTPVEIHWIRNQEQFKSIDGHAGDSWLAFVVGKRHWRYRWEPSVPLASWEGGIEAWTEAGYPDAFRKLVPSGIHRTVSSAHELRSFVSRSRTLPIGAMPVATISATMQHDMIADYRFTRDQREHGAFFNRPIQYTYTLPPPGLPDVAYREQLAAGPSASIPLYRQILKDIDIKGEVAP